MILALLLGLVAGPVPQSEQALLRSCEMTAEGWVCVYRIPPITAVPEPGSVVTNRTLEMEMAGPTAVAVPAPVVVDPAAVEANRLMLRCAEASWLSLCTPGDRRQARLLKDAADRRAALQHEVGRLLGEQQCDAAVRTALRAGDLAMAREARDFCQVGAAGATPPVSQ